MTVYTKAQFATRILRDAGLVGAEETPSAADLTFVQETLSAEMEYLGGKGITIWNGSEDLIPNKYYTTLSRRLTLAIGPAYGLFDATDATVAMEKLEGDL